MAVPPAKQRKVSMGLFATRSRRPFSRSQPRQGRYGRLAIGLLVFIIYFNLLSAGKAWLEQDTVPAEVGLWWVHALMLSLALGMLGIQNGVHRRLFAFRSG